MNDNAQGVTKHKNMKHRKIKKVRPCYNLGPPFVEKQEASL